MEAARLPVGIAFAINCFAYAIQSGLINVAEQHDKEAKVVDEVYRKAQSECMSCGDQFPDEVTTLFDQCAHEREFCPDCLERWVQIQLNSTMIEEGVRCPSSCTRILKSKDLQGSISTTLYERLKRVVIRAVLRKVPGYRECMLENCDSGQFHDDATDGHVFKFRRCGFLACTIHNVPFHGRETCFEYDERMELYASIIRMVEEASEKEVQRISKPCPNCTINIQKIDGCDHMRCQKCQHEFCYPCGASYTDMSSTDRVPHTVTCPHYIQPSRASLRFTGLALYVPSGNGQPAHWHY